MWLRESTPLPGRTDLTLCIPKVLLEALEARYLRELEANVYAKGACRRPTLTKRRLLSTTCARRTGDSDRSRSHATIKVVAISITPLASDAASVGVLKSAWLQYTTEHDSSSWLMDKLCLQRHLGLRPRATDQLPARICVLWGRALADSPRRMRYDPSPCLEPFSSTQRCRCAQRPACLPRCRDVLTFLLTTACCDFSFD